MKALAVARHVQRRFRLVLAGMCMLASASGARAQSVTLLGPTENPLRTVTPRFTVRANNFGASRPLIVTVQIARNEEFTGALLLDSTFTTSDTVVDVQVSRVLPSEAIIFWRATVRTNDGKSATSAVTGPRQLPPWIVLIAPVGIQDVRRPLLVWSSPRLAPEAGDWRFDIEVTTSNPPRVVLAATQLNDTTFRPVNDLDAETSYQWSVRATTRSGESLRVASGGTFIIIDPPLPTTTIFYQNFPNPFPSSHSFSTCFWFDIGARGANVTLEILDIRGNLIKTIIPGSDGISNFPAGRYGRGLPGGGNNCDNRFVWDGTASDGRTVNSGTYLARFRADRETPIWHKIVFLGR